MDVLRSEKRGSGQWDEVQAKMYKKQQIQYAKLPIVATAREDSNAVQSRTARMMDMMMTVHSVPPTPQKCACNNSSTRQSFTSGGTYR